LVFFAYQERRPREQKEVSLSRKEGKKDKNDKYSRRQKGAQQKIDLQLNNLSQSD
jgi:hypothetical protein